MKSLRAALILSALLGVGMVGSGCQKQQTPLDVAAPPPSNPNAKPEISSTKRMPPRPPAGPGSSPGASNANNAVGSKLNH